MPTCGMVNGVCIVKASQLDLSSLSTYNRTAVVLPINVCCLRRKRSEQRDDRRYGYAHRYQKYLTTPSQTLNNSGANKPLIGPSTMP